MDVYNIQDIPNRFFYKKGKFVSPLTLVAEEGWFIVEVKYRSKILTQECEKVQYIADHWVKVNGLTTKLMSNFAVYVKEVKDIAAILKAVK